MREAKEQDEDDGRYSQGGGQESICKREGAGKTSHLDEKGGELRKKAGRSTPFGFVYQLEATDRKEKIEKKNVSAYS